MVRPREPRNSVGFYCNEEANMKAPDRLEGSRHLMEAVRAECLRVALEAYEDAGVRGLCQEGRWEAAIDAIRLLKLDYLLHERH